MYKVQIKRDILGTISLFNWENVKIIMGDMNYSPSERRRKVKGREKEVREKEEKKKEEERK